jgi:hypothetical protein
MNKIVISVTDRQSQCYATITHGDTLVAQTRGRDAETAVREAVRQFRIARTDRIISARSR